MTTKKQALRDDVRVLKHRPGSVDRQLEADIVAHRTAARSKKEALRATKDAQRAIAQALRAKAETKSTSLDDALESGRRWREATKRRPSQPIERVTASGASLRVVKR